MTDRPLTHEQEREVWQQLEDDLARVDRELAAEDRARERADDPLLQWPHREGVEA